MASQVRYHRSKYQQLRQFAERLKRDLTELKKSNDALQRENEQHRLRLGHRNTDSSLNSNGKRPMVSASS
ncbi:hypothetical protein M413DRAFT_438098 [Hebeloma cylindrosporum]|uniref:Uncharacterized protein n=1 Tax=Hebeloma cylindrosporum TaxID=76867 RepID=A0A0C2YGV2_HEBCY|nr:hypothetical protein M413DRAFT_438098 [Hebeloma cylindrosporum h7]